MHYKDQHRHGEVGLNMIFFTESVFIAVTFRPGMLSVWIGEQGGNGTAFSLNTSIPSLSLFPPILHIEFHTSK
jgi:hypothetical protein